MANSLFADGDLAPAEQIVRDYLAQDEGNVGALRLLARICMERGALAEAQVRLERAVHLAPDYDDARFDLAAALLQQQKHEQARVQTGDLLTREPANRDYLKQHCAACIAQGDHEPVIDLCAKLLASPALAAAEIADLQMWRANALKVTGRQREAVMSYYASLAARPDHGVAWFSLANLKAYRFTDDEIARMRAAAEARPDAQEMDRIYLCFALGW